MSACWTASGGVPWATTYSARAGERRNDLGASGMPAVSRCAHPACGSFAVVARSRRSDDPGKGTRPRVASRSKPVSSSGPSRADAIAGGGRPAGVGRPPPFPSHPVGVQRCGGVLFEIVQRFETPPRSGARVPPPGREPVTPARSGCPQRPWMVPTVGWRTNMTAVRRGCPLRHPSRLPGQGGGWSCGRSNEPISRGVTPGPVGPETRTPKANPVVAATNLSAGAPPLSKQCPS